MQEFNLNYVTSKTHVNIENRTLHAKIGPFIKKNIELSNIQYFYVMDNKDYRELIIRYIKENGKTTNVRLICAYGVEDLDNLANTLGANLPKCDLRKMDSKEALKLMKAVNAQKMALIIVFILIPAILLVIFLPGLIHVMDSGHDYVTAKDIVTGKELSSRNLTLHGTILNQGMWEKTTHTQRGSTSTTEKNFFPMITEDWVEGEPVQILIETGEMSQSETDEFVYKTSFKGTIRNVLWEGIDSDQKDFFQKEYGITFSDNAILFEIIEGKPDQYIIYVFGAVVLILLITFVFVWIKYKKNN